MRRVDSQAPARVAPDDMGVSSSAAILLYGADTAAQIVPLAASGPLRNFALSKGGDLREEIGWRSLVRAVA